jgi:hypothetical protein
VLANALLNSPIRQAIGRYTPTDFAPQGHGGSEDKFVRVCNKQRFHTELAESRYPFDLNLATWAKQEFRFNLAGNGIQDCFFRVGNAVTNSTEDRREALSLNGSPEGVLLPPAAVLARLIVCADMQYCLSIVPSPNSDSRSI